MVHIRHYWQLGILALAGVCITGTGQAQAQTTTPERYIYRKAVSLPIKVLPGQGDSTIPGGEDDSQTKACTLPWGGELQHGMAVTAYQKDYPVPGETCTSEQRACSDGVLSGSFQHQSCVEPEKKCAATRVSWDGSTNGTVGTCSADLPEGNPWDYITVPHGLNDEYTGEASFTCYEGEWLMENESCSTKPATCNLTQHQSASMGSGTELYWNSSVASWETCEAECNSWGTVYDLSGAVCSYIVSTQECALYSSGATVAPSAPHAPVSYAGLCSR